MSQTHGIGTEDGDSPLETAKESGPSNVANQPVIPEMFVAMLTPEQFPVRRELYDVAVERARAEKARQRPQERRATPCCPIRFRSP